MFFIISVILIVLKLQKANVKAKITNLGSMPAKEANAKSQSSYFSAIMGEKAIFCENYSKKLLD